MARIQRYPPDLPPSLACGRGDAYHQKITGRSEGQMKFEFGDQTVNVNVATQADLMAEIRRRWRAGQGFALATVNLDHLVKMNGSPDFARIYAAQDLVVADGRPIVWLSRLAGAQVNLLPGSDLVLPLGRQAAEAGARVALVGSTQAALDDAAHALEQAAPGIEIVQRTAPAARFDPAGAEADAILGQLAANRVQLCLLALGAPKQETLALRGRDRAPMVGFASIGAGLDFLGGHQVRAPKWMRRLALEWLWRATQSPRRLGPRYARSFAILPRQIIRALRQRGG